MIPRLIFVYINSECYGYRCLNECIRCLLRHGRDIYRDINARYTRYLPYSWINYSHHGLATMSSLMTTHYCKILIQDRHNTKPMLNSLVPENFYCFPTSHPLEPMLTLRSPGISALRATRGRIASSSGRTTLRISRARDAARGVSGGWVGASSSSAFRIPSSREGARGVASGRETSAAGRALGRPRNRVAARRMLRRRIAGSRSTSRKSRARKGAR